ncbi:MAG: adenine nucleotide alpha hydrolase family protein [Chloroflexi bacterium]|nr:adenine nucleotide alpha hydrolase family protein [Chloroflexota bacterium]
MLCRHCDAKAVINMRQHKLALCGPHYVDWVHKQTARFIDEYGMFAPEDRVLVAVSGGKDSLALWDILLALGYPADGLYIGLGIGWGIGHNPDDDTGESEGQGYSDTSYGYIQDFVQARGGDQTLHVVDVAEEFGATIPAAARVTNRGREKPCSLCGLTKRHIMNRVARDGGYDVLATGHNLDDEAAVLLGNTLQWSVDYLARQGPVMPPSHPGLARKVKPLFRFYEREMAAYAIVRGIDYIYEECPFATGATTARYKDMLNNLELSSPGIKLQFYLRFLKAKKVNNLFENAHRTLDLLTCPTCGQPTTNPGECTFCRTWDRVRDRLAPSRT